MGLRGGICRVLAFPLEPEFQEDGSGPWGECGLLGGGGGYCLNPCGAACGYRASTYGEFVRNYLVGVSFAGIFRGGGVLPVSPPQFHSDGADRLCVEPVIVL